MLFRSEIFWLDVVYLVFLVRRFHRTRLFSFLDVAYLDVSAWSLHRIQPMPEKDGEFASTNRPTSSDLTTTEKGWKACARIQLNNKPEKVGKDTKENQTE